MAVRGHIEKISRNLIVGWIDFPSENEPAIIDILVDGEIVASEVRADLHRQDLQDLGIGDGFRGFWVEGDFSVDSGPVVVALQLTGDDTPAMVQDFVVKAEEAITSPSVETLASIPLEETSASQPDEIPSAPLIEYRVAPIGATRTEFKKDEKSVATPWQAPTRAGQHPDTLAGKDWVLINTNTHTRNIHITRAILDDARFVLGADKVHVANYNNVIGLCAKLDSPVLLCIDGQKLNPDLLDRAIRHCSAAALWTFDDPYNLNSHLKFASLFDLIFTNDSDCAEAYGERGIYLPLAAGADLTKKTDTIEQSFDIFFCGTAWPNRVTLINQLMRDRPGLRYKIALTYNAAVPPLPLNAPLSSYVQSLSFSDYIGYAQRSRITLSLHRNFSGTDVFGSSRNPGPRIFEIGAVGAYQISEHGGAGFEALFPAEELDYFDSYGDLLKLIDAAMADPGIRASSANRLRERVAEQHTYRHRIKTIGELLAHRCAEQPAPSVPAVTARKRPRLMYVVHNTINSPSFGGLEVHQDILAQNLKERYEIFFFFMGQSGESRLGVLTDSNYSPVLKARQSAQIGHANLENPTIESFFAQCLSTYDFDFVHFFHFIHSTPSLAHIVRSYAIPYGISFHDFYTACREFNLLDYNRRYCRNDHTRLTDCDICLKRISNVPAKSQQTRRDYFGDVLARADTLMFVSDSTKQIHEAIYPQIALARARRVHGAPIPHPKWPLAKIRPVQEEDTERRVRFLVLGNFEDHKGANYLLEALTACTDLRAEFHFHGGVSEPVRKSYFSTIGDRAIFHGRYRPGEVNIAQYDFSLHISIWPETYCQTLSEAWAARVVPIVSDIGALGQRVIHGFNGYKIDPDRPATLSKLMLAITTDLNGHLALRENITDAMFLDQYQHAELYHEAYDEVLRRRVVPSKQLSGREGIRGGVNMEVLQRRRRTPFWNQGRGAHPKGGEYVPDRQHLRLLQKLQPFTGNLSYADYSCLDTIDDKPVDLPLMEPIQLKNMQELLVSGWVSNVDMESPVPVALLETGGGRFLFQLNTVRRPDVASVHPVAGAETWGMSGGIRLLTPDAMLTGPVQLTLGWHDEAGGLVRLGNSSVQLLGAFGA